MEIVYHEGKANVVADALSRKFVHALFTAMSWVRLHEEVEKMGISMIKKGDTIGDLTIKPELYAEIREKQMGEPTGATKCESISMDFIVGLPRTQKGNNMIWVIVDRLTKLAHFIHLKDTLSKAELAKAYVKYEVKLHGVAIFDGDSVEDEYAFYPATDGQTERIIQTLEDMLRACVMELGFVWKEVQDSDRQKSYADLKRSEIEFAVGDKVLLKVSLMKGLRKYVSYPTHVLEPEHVEIHEQLSYVEVPKEILDRKVRKTRNG
ncbi:uncharacterized protein LOC141631644 [Silene latifolia]|uniref:uncharacterized protein LOC141631644 n=1 Tax=Silene latifolia TaxID=37657 RepID=UPI003D76DE44